MPAPSSSTSALYLSALGASSASLFLPPGFGATTFGPSMSSAALGFGEPPAAPSILGPIACDPELPPFGPCGVDGAARPAGSAFGARPFGAS
eukprot:15971171-Heterocapsa_arctica.AAC.1